MDDSGDYYLYIYSSMQFYSNTQDYLHMTIFF
jgi:hypothetical protein